MRYFKRMYAETIQRFNKDWDAWDWYYFEVGDDNYATKQIQKCYDGKIFKYDENYIEDENGGLAEGALEIKEYTQIVKEEFDKLWNSTFTNTYIIKQLSFDEHWKMAWYNIDYNKTEQQLYDGNLILCGTYKDVFLLEIEYGEYNQFLSYKICEGSANIKYSTVDNWDELVSCVQLWINYIEKKADTVYSKPQIEKIESTMKVLLDRALQDATFSMYRNMDWDLEKFRGAYLTLADNNYCIINTFIGVEDLMIALQDSLPKKILIQSCMFCKYSNYMVAGNDNFGDLNCFVHCREKCENIKSKNDIMDLFDSEFAHSKKVQETFYCTEFAAIEKHNFVYKNQIEIQ
jgi:hypothetical protein